MEDRLLAAECTGLASFKVLGEHDSILFGASMSGLQSEDSLY